MRCRNCSTGTERSFRGHEHYDRTRAGWREWLKLAMLALPSPLIGTSTPLCWPCPT